MRLLKAEEWNRLTPIFAEMNWHLPPPDVALVVVEEDEEGEIIAFQLLQLILAAEPHWEREDARGKVNWREMGRKVEEVVSQRPLFAGVIVHATSENVEKMCKIMGMEEYPCKTFIKQISSNEEKEEANRETEGNIEEGNIEEGKEKLKERVDSPEENLSKAAIVQFPKNKE